MPELYPLPSHAASFWIAGDDLWIAFPGQGPEERGHSIRLPASSSGLHAAITIMKARSKERSLLLGNRGTPTQYEMEIALSSDDRYKAWLKAMTEDKEATAKSQAAARAELEELGL